MVKDKTPGVTKARRALEDYLKANNLDVFVDWRKDPIHGKRVTQLINKLNIERDKLAYEYPMKDLKNTVKLLNLVNRKRMAKKEKKAKVAEEKEEKKLVKKTKSEKPAKKEKVESKKPTKYDYPLIDGREMTSEEKKKYRMEQRKLAAGKTPKPKKEKEEKPKKIEKPSKEEKSKKKVKKAKKEED